MKCHLVSCAALALIALTGCGGGGGVSDLPPGSTSSSSGGGGLPPASTAPALKTELAARFGTVNYPVGAAIEPASTTTAPDSTLLLKHFSSVTAENAMKPDTVWPNAPGSTTMPAASPNFIPADAIYNFAITNGIQVRGHTLLWHQTAPTWFFAGDTASPNYRINVQQRLCQYIDAVMRRLPQIYAWDVVTEVASDSATAIELLETKKFCGLVLDLVLDGGSGFDVLRHLNRKRIDLPTVVISSRLPDYVRELLVEDQVKLILAKPLDVRLLATIVRGLCGLAA